MSNAHWVRFTVALGIVAIAAAWAGNAYAQENPYKVCEAWGQLPEGRSWGNVTGVGVDHHGNVWVVDRCGSKGKDPCVHSSVDPITEFDATGKFVKSFGAGTFVLPHSLYLDKDDNLWIADEAALDGKGNIVAKYSPEGKLLLTLGTPGVYGTGPNAFSEVTDAVVAPNGDIFVADGHQFPPQTNTRVVKYSKDGKFIKAWGKPGMGPGEFHEIHSIAMDSAGRVLAGDRGNGRIQIFDQDGKLLGEWKQFGQPRGIFVDPNDTMYVTDEGTTDSGEKSSFARGIRIGSAKDGAVTGYIPPSGAEVEQKSSQLRVAADARGDLYVAEFAAGLGKCVKK